MISIILRTVCGCERIVEIPFRYRPRTFTVPYVRRQDMHIYPADGESCMTAINERRRVFERTANTGKYGYTVYLEVLDK